jgi:glycine cleavage system H protein
MYNPFHFIDIYATKGIEYLWVLGYLAVFVPFIMFVRRQGNAQAVQTVPQTEHQWFRIPKDLFYHLGHAWAGLDADGTVKVGLDQFARMLVGRVQGLVVPQVGQSVEQGQSAWSLRVNGKEIAMVSPVDGEVVEVNEAVLNAPHLLDADTYDRGWLFKVRPSRLTANLRNLLDADKAAQLTQEAMDALFATQSQELGLVYQDGGQPVDGLARAVDPENWDKLAARHFLTD